MADWVVHVLPDLGDSYSYGVDINLWGDVAGYYVRADGTRDRFVYNPFTDPPQNAVTFNLASTSLAPDANINDQGLVAHHFYTDGPVEVYEVGSETATLVQSFDLGRIGDSISFNNAGTVAAIKRAQTSGGKRNGRRYDFAVQIDSATGNSENVQTSDGYSLWVYGNQYLNSHGDMAFHNAGKIELAHRGFPSDTTQQIWNVDDLISENDPWRADWIASESEGFTVGAISDRSDQDDASGYPVLAATFYAADGAVKCAVLTPVNAP